MRFKVGDFVTRTEQNTNWQQLCARRGINPTGEFVVNCADSGRFIGLMGIHYAAFYPKYFTLVTKKEVKLEDFL